MKVIFLLSTFLLCANCSHTDKQRCKKYDGCYEHHDEWVEQYDKKNQKKGGDKFKACKMYYYKCVKKKLYCLDSYNKCYSIIGIMPDEAKAKKVAAIGCKNGETLLCGR